MAANIHPGGICDAVRITPRRRADRDRSHRRTRSGEHVPWPTARRPGRWSSSSAPPSSTRSTAIWRRWARRAAGGSCSSPARRGSARRRSCGPSASARARAGSCGARATRSSPRARSGRSWTSPTSWAASSPPWWPRARAAGALLAALARSLRGRPPDIVVLEDLHWADEATLDVLRLLARRIESLPALVLATYRDDEIDPRHPLRMVLGELPSGSAARLALAPLSAQGVAELAGSLGVDHAELHRRTAGNPFYVTEVLAAADAEIPETVRDAVLARAARLDEQRAGGAGRRGHRADARRALAALGAGRRRAGRPRRLPGLRRAARRARRGALPPRDRAGGRRRGALAPSAPRAAPQRARGARRARRAL